MDEIKSIIEKSDNMNDDEIVLSIKQHILDMQEKKGKDLQEIYMIILYRI